VDAFNAMLDEIDTRTAALRASERLYRAIGESIDYGVWVADADGRCIYVSDSFLQLVGLTAQECCEFGWASKLHPEERDATMAAWAEAVRDGTPWYREQRVLGVDGRYHPLLAQGVPIRDDGGRITRWAGINLDIERMKRTEEALRDADRRKDEFLATLAHELRNPLAPIRHAAKLLDAPNAEPRHVHWARDVISRQVARMALLLDDLLDVSRITRGLLSLKRQPVELGTVIAAAVETAQPLIDAKHHLLTVRLPATPLTLSADPLRLSQAVSNLLTNSAKYTDAGGRIQLQATVDADGLEIAVSDTGIGLAPEAVPNLFEMFSQVDAAHERTEGGLGIGLALVRGLVELHGGRVGVRSAGLGHGSTFTITLPAAALLPAGTVRERPSVTPSAPSPGRTLIVADDNRDAADALATVLRLAGHDVHVAYGGRDALELADRVRPDALILDLGMPDVDGHEVARAVRRRDWGADVVLLAVTGWGQEVDRQRSRAAGFDHHLTKPVDSEDLQRLIAGSWRQERAISP
jgi:PAS domain S-box-containing protein